MRLIHLLILTLAILQPSSALAKRVAIVIGNDTYQTLPQLNNAARDARDMASMLSRLGFEVIVRTDAGSQEIGRALAEFEAKASGAEAALVFYAGHGIQADGVNWLIPSDANVEVEADLRFEGIRASELLETMKRAGADVNILILDACRDNPLPKRVRSGARGLEVLPIPKGVGGTAILYSAGPGEVAQDGVPGENGIFTDALLKAMEEPGLDLQKVFQETARQVQIATNRAQTPFINTSISGEFFFQSPEQEQTVSALNQQITSLKLQLAMEEVQKRDTRIRELVNELASVTADRGEELEDHRALKVRSKELEIKLDSVRAELAEAAEKRSLANDEIKAHKNQLSSLQRSLAQAESRLTEEQQISAEALARVTLLNRQTASLRLQLASMQKALESSESKNKERQVQITSLSKRLNQALATKVQELARFRSEFFGRLREVLKGRRDIRIVGDRFVFQSEVLFASGSAEIGSDGQKQLAGLSRTLSDIASRIPPSINWILQVEGHTDHNPINTPLFQSNWDLSAARAISVVNILIKQGIPANRLSATGYGEFQPFDKGTSEVALRRNRRIEIKLTQR